MLIYPVVDNDIDGALEDDVPTGAFVALIEEDGASSWSRFEDEDRSQFPLDHRRKMRKRFEM